MSSNRQPTKRLRKEIVSAVKSDRAVQESQVTVHHCVTMSPDSGSLAAKRRTRGEAEYVEGGSVAMRSGTVQHSRDRPLFGLGFGPKENDYLEDLEASETGGLPKRPSKDKTLFSKKTLQNSSS